MKKIIQTAGRDALGKFAPNFARYNDDILFGENWNDTSIDHKTRCIITIVSLISSGITDSSLKYHISNAKNAGVCKDEVAAIITNTAFYAGWPKAWAAFNIAKEVYADEGALSGLSDEPKPSCEQNKEGHEKSMIFPIGELNSAFSAFFTGISYLHPISTEGVNIYNVTFEPGCRNHWHIHKAAKGGGQILLCVAGRGYYQEWGKEEIEMNPGDCINIPPNVKHRHGATVNSWFSHLSIEVPGDAQENVWLEEGEAPKL